MQSKHDRNYYIEKLNEIHNSKYDYSKIEKFTYKGKLTVICPIHGEFLVTLCNHLSNKRGCPKCARERTIAANTKDLEHFLVKSKEIHGDFYDYSKSVYNGAREKLCIICPKHGEFWQTPTNHYKFGCELCGNERIRDFNTIDKSHIIKRLNEIYKNEYEYDFSNYENTKTPIKIKHLKCKNEYFQTINKHLYQQHGCPYCKLSKGQKYITEVLIHNDIDYKMEYYSDWLKSGQSYLKIDVYDVKHNIAIEFQGEQHFKPIDVFGGEENLKHQLERDERKKKLCEEKGIRMLYVVNNISDVNWNIPIYTKDNVIELKDFEEYINKL